MQDIRTLLIQNGIPPTWVDQKAENSFSRRLKEAEERKSVSFSRALRRAKTNTEALEQGLEQVEAMCREAIDAAVNALDKALSLFSDSAASFHTDNRRLTRAHLRLLEDLIPIHDGFPQILNALALVENQNQKTLLSHAFILDMTLRRIALEVAAPGSKHLDEYRRHTREPLPGEQIAARILTLRGLIVESVEQLALAINTSSDVITAINKKRAAATEYANLIRRLMLGLHDIRQKVMSY